MATHFWQASVTGRPASLTGGINDAAVLRLTMALLPTVIQCGGDTIAIVGAPGVASGPGLRLPARVPAIGYAADDLAPPQPPPNIF